MHEDVDFSRIAGQDHCKSNCVDGATSIDRKTFMTWLICNHQPMSEAHARNLSYYIGKILRQANNCNPTIEEAQDIAARVLMGETSKSNKRLKLIALEYWMQYIGRHVHFKKPRATKRNPKYLTEEQMRLLIRASKNYRDAAILELLCSTGMRIGELRELNTDDLDFSNGVIRIRHGKGDKEREVYMTDECRRFLNAYVEKWKIAQGALFVSSRGTRISKNAL